MNLPSSPPPDRPPRVDKQAPEQGAPAVTPAPAQEAVAGEPAREQARIVEGTNEGTDALSKKDWILTLLMVSLILVAVVADNVRQVGAWFASTWSFLNEPTEPSWWQGLMSGLVSALISAAVALIVVFFTVRAQNRGIQQQLITQRHENIRVREHEIAFRFLNALRGFTVAAGVEKERLLKQDPTPLKRTDIMNEALEELRLNLDSDDDRVIDAFLFQVSNLRLALMDYHNDETNFFEEPFGVLAGLEGFLKLQLLRYMRATVPERIAMASFLKQASADLRSMRIKDWTDRYR